jgi:hypothetical protein
MADKVISEIPAEVKEAEAKSPGTGETPEEKYVDNGRVAVEDVVIKENTTFPDAVIEETPKPAETDPKEPVVEKEPERSIEDKVKEKIQKRIDKEVAKRKTAEEEAAELRAENERLKAQIKPEPKSEADAKREPTDAEVRAALIKAKQEGDTEFEVQILEFMAERKAKAERLAAEKAYEENQKKQSEDAQRLQSDWNGLVLDYIVRDDKGAEVKSHALNLNNQNSLLYKTALALFNDKELRASHYNDPNKVTAFRRAVGDAYREISQNNLHVKDDPKKVVPDSGDELIPSKPVRRNVAQLAEPGSETSEEPVPVKILSDTDKVIDEIKNRRKFIEERARG